jgi:hypothetical protein
MLLRENIVRRDGKENFRGEKEKMACISLQTLICNMKHIIWEWGRYKVCIV